MSLIVEDGSVVSGAESYCTVAFAIDYLTRYYPAATFLTSTTTEQEVFLRLATQYIEGNFKSKWSGTKNYDAVLSWPRYEAYDDGVLVDSETVPTKVQEAASYYAYVLGEGDSLQEDLDYSGIKSESVEIGPIKESYEYVGSKNQTSFSVPEGIIRSLFNSNQNKLFRG